MQVLTAQGDSRVGHTHTTRTLKQAKSLSNASVSPASCCWMFPGILMKHCCLFHMFHVGGSFSWDIKPHFFFFLLYKEASITPLYWFQGAMKWCIGSQALRTHGAAQPNVLLQCFSQPNCIQRHPSSVLHFWNAALLADSFIFVLTSNYCLGYLGPGINAKHISILLQWKYKETDYCMDFTVLALPVAGAWSSMILEVPSNPCRSMILWNNKY